MKHFAFVAFTVATTIAVSGCGSINAAEPLPTPSMEETTAPLPTLPPVEQDQVFDALEATLDKLQPPEPGIRGAVSLGDPIGAFVMPQDCQAIAEWLDFPLPYFPTLATGEVKQVCGVVNSAGDLPFPERSGRAADGGPLSGVAISISAPKDLDVLQLTWEQLQEKGVAVSRVEWGTRDSEITELDPTNSIDPAGGYTMARLKSNPTALTIQNLGMSTRIAYTKATPTGEIYLVSLDFPGSAVSENVQEFLAGQNIG